MSAIYFKKYNYIKGTLNPGIDFRHNSTRSKIKNKKNIKLLLFNLIYL